MAGKKVAYEAQGNHWFWRAKNHLDAQTGTLVTMPESGRITRVEFKVGGIIYADPVYGWQNYPGYVVPTIWSASGGKVLSKGSATQLPQVPPFTSGGALPWVSFDIPDLAVEKDQKLIVGFWRRSSSTGFATQWDYNNSSASGWTTYAHHITNSANGPLQFSISETYLNRSINFRLHYESGGGVHIWNGRSWQPKKLATYNASPSTFPTASVLVWDGTTWNEGKS